ncbi:hypothetical protein OEZ86_008035 [Tetradesmus obliquus]|nr:hypothetical protein OEZ86_008035 [Tetradesmus obliquus]
MVKHTKKGKNRLDKYYYLAKEQGFRSRAAFKLIQLNRKYNFLANCRALLDLCAAPGGWMQVAAKSMPLGSLILGVDLMPIKPIRGAKSFISDITTQQCRQLLKREAGGSLFDVVVHDGAPNVGGAWASEAYTQSALVVDALALAVEFLAPGGTFVTKIFRSKDYNALLYAFGQLFNKVDATKPQASRNASAEIFVVCLGYKAPAKVDPRLLDPKVLFQEVAEAPKVMGPEALLKQKIKQKRHREGYEEGLSSSHRALPAAAFLLSATPIEMLGQATQLVISGKAAEAPVAPEANEDGEQQQPLALDWPALAAAIASHAATDAEIKALCSDLQVLGRSEFKALLRWRLAVRKDLKPLLGAAGEGEAAKTGSHKKQQQQQQGEEGEEQQQQDAEAKLMAEMEAVKDAAEQRVRRERRKRREAKKKAKLRAAQLLLSQGGDEGVEAAPDGESLFSLGAIDGAAAAAAAAGGGGKGGKKASDVIGRLAAAAAPGAAEMELLEEPDSDGMVSLSDDDSDASSLDSEEEALDYEAQLEEQLEDAYQQYLHRKGVRDAALKEKRQRLGKGGELGSDDEAGAEDGAAAAAAAAAAAGDDDDEEASSGDEDDTEQYAAALQQAADASDDEEAAAGGGLLVQLEPSRAGVAKGGAAAAAQWFGQDLFGDPNVALSSEEEEEEEQQQQQRGAAAAGKRQRQDAAAAAAGGKKQQQSAAEDESDEEEQAAAAAKKKRKGQNGVMAAAAGAAAAAAAAAGSGFEEVAASSSDSEGGSGSEQGGGSSSDDSDAEEFDALDDAGKAEVLALAKRMLRRKDKESILEAAYNRYAFHDDKLPRWFAEDERRHMRPIPQVSKAEVEEERARLAAIDARPIKKVAEAKARKRKRMQVRLDAARAKATSVAAQEDVPMASKMKEIENIYAKARAMNGPGKKGGKGGGKRGGDKRKGPALDKRMKADKRGMKKAEKAKKGGRKGKGGGVQKGGRKGGKR